MSTKLKGRAKKAAAKLTIADKLRLEKLANKARERRKEARVKAQIARFYEHIKELNRRVNRLEDPFGGD